MIFYKGPSLIGPGDLDLAQHNEMHAESQLGSAGWIASTLAVVGVGRFHLGVLCLISNCMCMAAFLALQVT